MSSPRADLAAALTAASPSSTSVFAEEPATAPSLPALYVRPGAPYRGPGAVPHCLERWRLEVVALVAVDVVAPLDELDGLVDVARDVIRAMAGARYNGVRQAPAILSIAGKSMRGAIVELDVDL